MVQKSRRRVIRMLRRLGYLEAGTAAATGYAPLRDDTPELARTLAASVHQRDQLERLIRYTARGAVSLERLT